MIPSEQMSRFVGNILEDGFIKPRIDLDVAGMVSCQRRDSMVLEMRPTARWVRSSVVGIKRGRSLEQDAAAKGEAQCCRDSLLGYEARPPPAFQLNSPLLN